MKPSEFITAVTTGTIAPVYFFIGTESAVRHDALMHLEEKLLPIHVRDFNKDVLEAQPGDGEKILAMAQSLPMGAGRRLLIVSADALGAHDWNVLSPYIGAPLLTTCLVLVLGKPPKAVAPVNVVSCDQAEGPSDIREFLSRELTVLGKKVSGAAQGLLLGMEWESLQELRQEVEKLSLSVGERNVIEKDDVIRMCYGRGEVGAFALTDSLGNRTALEALRIVGDHLDRGERETAILARLAGHIRRLAVTQDLLADGKSIGTIREALGGKSYPVQKFAAQAARFSRTELMGLLEKFLVADGALKGGPVPARVVIERLILDVAGYPRT